MFNNTNDYNVGYSQQASQEKLQQQWRDSFQDAIHVLQCRYAEQQQRITQLEKLVQYPNTAKQDMREAAAKAQANEHLYAPLRSDTAPLIRLAAFARRLLDPSDLGHAVTEEVRNLAREALGK